MDLQAVKARVSWAGEDEKGEHSHKSPRNEVFGIGPIETRYPQVLRYRMPSFCVQHCRVWLVGTCN